MNTNEIRFYLHNYDGLKKEIEALKAQLEEYRKMNISGIKAQVITDMPVHHSNTSKTEEMAVKRVEYIADLEQEIDSKMRLLRAINGVYFYLSDPARSIIEKRYFEIPQGRPKYNWREIAIEICGAKSADDIIRKEKECWKIDGKIVRDIQVKLLDTQCEIKKRVSA